MISDNTNDDGPKNNQEESFSKRLPFDALEMGEREGRTNGKEKKKNDQSREKIPEGVMDNVYIDKTKVIQVERKVKNDH